MTYWHGLIISRTKRLNFWQKFLHFIFCQKYFLESIRIILDGDRLSVHSEKSPCFNSRCIMDWNVSSLSHVWTFLNMMNREYLVENFQVLYNWLFRNFQFSNFNFFFKRLNHDRDDTFKFHSWWTRNDVFYETSLKTSSFKVEGQNLTCIDII